jgi:thiamine biosynthesis lipoprotein
VVRKRYEIHVWGTVLFLDLGSTSITEGSMDAAVESVKEFVYEVDEVFSTYKEVQ